MEKQTLSRSPARSSPGGSACACGRRRGRARGLCNAGSHVCSLPGCAAGRRPGLPRSRAAGPAAGPARLPCSPRPAGRRRGPRRGGGFGSLRGAEPLGRGLARNGGGAGLAAEVAQPPPLPRPSLKKGCASRHFSSLKIQLSPSFARLAFALGLAHAGLPGSAGHRHRGGFALPRVAARGLAREGGRPLGVGGRRLRAPAGARHSAMLAGAVFLRRVSRPPSRCLSVPGLPPPRGLGSARWKRGTRPPPPPRPLAGALPLLKRATVADAGLGWPGPRTCSARPLRPTVRRPRARRRPREPRRLWPRPRAEAGARRCLWLTSWELVAMACLGAPDVPEALCSCHRP